MIKKSFKYLFASCTFLVGCVTNNHVKEISAISLGKYYSIDSLLLVEVQSVSDSLIGKHCFVSFDGSKIDCCLIPSLFLKENGTNIFTGKMTSCLNNENYNIILTFKHDSLIFVIQDDNHEFVKKNNLLFHKKYS